MGLSTQELKKKKQKTKNKKQRVNLEPPRPMAARLKKKKKKTAGKPRPASAYGRAVNQSVLSLCPAIKPRFVINYVSVDSYNMAAIDQKRSIFFRILTN